MSRAEAVIAFLEDLPITKGLKTGKKMKLLPIQREFVKAVYGKRKVELAVAVQSLPRGNGKTGLLSGLCLAHLFGPEAEQRGEIYSAAIDRQQAGIMFNEMEAIILAKPEFASVCNIKRWHKAIEVDPSAGRGGGSTFEALSADARRAHGLSPTLWVYDELAQAKDRVLLEGLMTAQGKRERSLGIVISTQAARDDHPLSELIDRGLAGDERIYVQLLCADKEDDLLSEATLLQCNPAAGVFLNKDAIFANLAHARNNPSFEGSYRNLRLNMRVDASEEVRLCPPAVWKLGNIAADMERLRGRTCYAALDLSGKHDLCAFILCFPDDAGGYDVLCFFWTPEDQLDARRPAERDKFKEWIRRGFITAIPGPVIRFDWVAQKLVQLADEFDIRAVAYDRWRIEYFKQELTDRGRELNLIEHGQGFKDMGQSIDHLSELVALGRLRHGGNPVLTACMANAVIVTDPAGNRKFDKGKSNKGATVRIDGIVALAMAIGIAHKRQEPPPAYQIMILGG